MIKPYGWLEEVEESLVKLQGAREAPSLPAFPKKVIEESFSKLFATSASLQIAERGLRSSEELLSALPSDGLSLKGFIQPMGLPFYVAAPSKEMAAFFAHLSGAELKEGEQGGFFLERDYLVGFFHFLGAEALSQLQKHWLRDFSFEIQDGPFSLREELEGKNFALVDIEMSYAGGSLWFKLMVPAALQTDLRRFYARKQPTLSSEKMAQIPTEISIEAGRTSTTFSELSEIKVGDFLLIDRPYISLPGLKGRLVLSFDGKPLFRGKVEGEAVRVLSYPTYEEVASMDDENDEEYEEEEEEGLYSDEDEIYDEEEDEELLPFPDHGEGELAEQEEPIESASLPEEAEEQEESRLGESELEGEPIKIAPEDIPLELTVELSRLRINASDLMKIAPGDLLDIKVSGERPVSLVLNGKRLLSGELVAVKDLLFVRILKGP